MLRYHQGPEEKQGQNRRLYVQVDSQYSEREYGFPVNESEQRKDIIDTPDELWLLTMETMERGPYPYPGTVDFYIRRGSELRIESRQHLSEMDYKPDYIRAKQRRRDGKPMVVLGNEDKVEIHWHPWEESYTHEGSLVDMLAEWRE